MAPDTGKRAQKSRVPVRKAHGKVMSTLPKMWNKFLILGDIAILNGHYSQSHKRFKGIIDQGSSCCVMACAFSELRKVETWIDSTIDDILILGTILHNKSVVNLNNKCLPTIDPSKVYKYFFLGNDKITMKIGVDDVFTETLRLDTNPPRMLRDKFIEFFRTFTSGIFASQMKYLAVWNASGHFFLMDPTEHKLDGSKWTGVPGLGYAYVVKLDTLQKLCEVILANLAVKYSTKIAIYPCSIEKVVHVDTTPPETVDGKLLPPPHLRGGAPKGSKAKLGEKKSKKDLKKAKEAVVESEVQKVESDGKVPVERPRLESTTHFQEIDFGAINGGILRATTHQSNPEFSKFTNGEQSFSNAVAALTMLRLYKAKHWVRKLVDCVLRLGEMVYQDYRKLPPQQFPEVIKVCTKKYSPKIEHHAVVGRLQVSDEALLDLLGALTGFLIDNDGCVVMGPIIVAIWVEDNFYYMFDPNERDGNGLKRGCPPPGVACVTWYENLKDLVEVYMANVDKLRKREYFTLTKCTIENYEELSDPWKNFKSLKLNKWILRGTFSQASRRFETPGRNMQCTANATMALVYKGVKEVEEWDSKTVDQVLIYGDDFYRTTVAELEEAGKFMNPLLMVDELKRELSLENKQILLDVNDCLVNGVVSARSDSSIPNLRKGFEEFFELNEAGVLTSHGISIAVWKQDDTYYYYDSHNRDDKGTICQIGTACLLRMCDLAELANSVRANLKGSRDDSFNLSRIGVQLLETKDGIVLPPLNNYEALGEMMAILKSTYSESSEKFDLNCGKQTVPMCLAAIGFNALEPSFDWTKQDLDDVLIAGDKLYVETLEENLKKLDQGEEFDSDVITSLNIKKDFVLGMNKITLEFEDYQEKDNFEELTDVLREYYQIREKEEEPKPEGEEEVKPVAPVVAPVEPGEDDDDEENVEVEVKEEEKVEIFDIPKESILLESDYVTVSIWGDDKLIYLFDPKPRDGSGQVFGKDEWSVKIEPIDEEEELERDDLGGGDNFGERKRKIRMGDEDDEEEEDEEDDNPPPTNDDEDEDDEDRSGESEEAGPPVPPPKKGADYWHAQELENGKGCVLRFSKPQDLIKHLLDSTPPTKREELAFKIKKVTVVTEPVTKELDDPEIIEKKDEFVGDWNNFKETDYGRWILRGHRTFDNALYPELNRGRQDVPMSLTAVAYAFLYSLSKFTSKTIDGILGYGDRLMSATRRRRIDVLKEALKISEDDAEKIALQEIWHIGDYPRKICLGDYRVDLTLFMDFVVGDVTATDVEDVLDLLRGLTKLFEVYSLGILTAKDITVAVWKRRDIFYMFDCRSRGPNGGKSPVGVACVTRFKELQHLVDLLLSNLPKEGPNIFSIHALTGTQTSCERPRHPEEIPKPVKKLGGFVEIIAGKSILRSDVGGDFTHYDRGVHVASAAIAFIALTMSLVQKAETWTKLMVDEIMNLGRDLHQDSIRKMAVKFNPWTDEIDLHRVNNDFKVGVLQANCELRFMDQKGLVDTKEPKKVNLRQGIERFFDENTHGILCTDRLVLGLWEEERDDDEVVIYMFDPNARGGTGMPMMGGTPCILKFCNAKMASDHIMAAVSGPDKDKMPFVITPVEIVVGKKRSCCGKKGRKIASKFLTGASSPSKIQVNTAKCRHEQAQAIEEKRKLRKIAQEELIKKRERRLAALGRNEFYKLTDSKWILRGMHHMQPDRDLATNIVASVLMRVLPMDKWTHKHIDNILNTGNQLYIDSTVAYRPTNPKLGFENILRIFFMKPLEVQINIYKPLEVAPFTSSKVTDMLSMYFQQENFVMIGFRDSWVSIFFKAGYYYLFDPYSRNLDGVKVDDGSGWAMLMKFGDLVDLGETIAGNLGDGLEENPEGSRQEQEGEEEVKKSDIRETFSMVLVGLASVRRSVHKTTKQK